jgi:hypothetical protein
MDLPVIANAFAPYYLSRGPLGWTVGATHSSNSYARFLCGGGLLLIDMCFLLLFSCYYMDTGKTLRKQSLSLFAGWSDPTILLGSQRLPKTGSLQPIQVFCPVQIDRRAMRNLYAPNNFRSPVG